VPLTICFDGTGTGNGLIALAALAADDDLWPAFNQHWRAIMARVKPDYMHMRKAMPLRGPFAQWKPALRDAILEELFQLIMGETQFHAFSCAIDLASFAKWRTPNNLPQPEDLCVFAILHKVSEWYCSGDSPPTIELLFDQNEPFAHRLVRHQENKNVRRAFPIWNHIRIRQVDMRLNPGVQAADMLAWALNRTLVDPADSIFKTMAANILRGPSGFHVYLTDDNLPNLAFSLDDCESLGR